MNEFAKKERIIEQKRLDNEVADQELSLAQKKALIKEAKSKYGRDWKKIIGMVKSVKLNAENMQTLHSLGGGGENLRSLGNPYKRVGS
jgi:hypothetical protein